MTNALDTNEETILKVLEDSEEPLRPGDVAEATGIDSKMVSKSLASLKKKGLVCSPKRCYYDITN
ncbi:MAG: helix-turn-helix domain-containing protein [Methanococcoides sp.]|uniref:Helix-turn-helix transcriptional regulator n=1 Tax=Methanococcoides seepicolus TaxID=2828780 RepID=A0A9E5D8H2_9EURY|nr:helix-turn-helix domain-containing protein [Methanococcoides seepicolus]MCD4807097.1 helix-turn-helix domain-containing protein [Methanococcoides sp.]MCM1985615.1 helix-turn-helix transcriptional regulator [Methanococcoides seepicolus]